MMASRPNHYSQEEIEEIVLDEAPRLLSAIKDAARPAAREEEFKIPVEAALSNLLQSWGLVFDPEYERPLIRGPADAVYNRFIIEYKRPGRLSDQLAHKPTADAVSQVVDYLESLAQKENHPRDQLRGVAMDGAYFIFVRFHRDDGKFKPDPPLAVSMASTTQFLRTLLSLRAGKALTPANLLMDFGHEQRRTKAAIKALFEASKGAESGLAAKLFEQWTLFFGEVTAYDEIVKKSGARMAMLRFAASLGITLEDKDFPRFFFCLHTVFSFLVKMIGRLVVSSLAPKGMGLKPLAEFSGLEEKGFHRELEHLESGDNFGVLGIRNLLEGDFFSWYLHAWTPQLVGALRALVVALADYNPATIRDDPDLTRDLLKRFYQGLLPSQLRHDLGEYYTPDWLAAEVMGLLEEPQLDLRLDSKDHIETKPLRVLDPACGSGTFLVMAIRAWKERARQCHQHPRATLQQILEGLVGIDLNPLAVLSSRINYLLAISDLLRDSGGDGPEIPVYLSDSIAPPGLRDMFDEERLQLPTAVGTLELPPSVDSRAALEALTGELEHCIRSETLPEVFVDRAAHLLEPTPDKADRKVLLKTYSHLLDLHKKGLNGIWGRILKNAFMPRFLQSFDYIVGNPPWVNWEHLSPKYRERTQEHWVRYGLTGRISKGGVVSLGKKKKDLSTLLTLAVVDRHLKDRGKLAFLITKSVFKTGASAGFRRFQLPDNSPLGVLRAADFSDLKPFEGAATSPVGFVLERGGQTDYPVLWEWWEKTKTGRRVRSTDSREKVRSMTTRHDWQAQPAVSEDSTSIWMVGQRAVFVAVGRLLGKSAYRAFAGLYTGGANGVFWVEVLETLADGSALVRNLGNSSKPPVTEVTARVEGGLLHPLVRERRISRWSAQPDCRILLPLEPTDIRKPLDKVSIQGSFPLTYGYLFRFKEKLLSRGDAFIKDRLKAGEPFWMVSSSGPHHSASYKVLWSRFKYPLEACVLGCSTDPLSVPQETVSFVPLEERDEADFVCSLLNSSVFSRVCGAVFPKGSKSFGLPSMLETLRIPKFNPTSPTHKSLAALSRQAHSLVADGTDQALAKVKPVEAQIDTLAAQVWSLTPAEMTALTR